MVKLYQTREFSEFYKVPEMEFFIKYCKTLPRFKKLNDEERNNLIQRVQSEEKGAVEELQKQYGHFVTNFAEKYIIHNPNLTFDILGSAYFGLVRAAKIFKMKGSFEYLAKAYIRLEMIRSINEEKGTKFNEYVAVRAVRDFQEKYFKKNGIFPRPEEIEENVKGKHIKALHRILIGIGDCYVKRKNIISKKRLTDFFDEDNWNVFEDEKTNYPKEDYGFVSDFFSLPKDLDYDEEDFPFEDDVENKVHKSMIWNKYQNFLLTLDEKQRYIFKEGIDGKSSAKISESVGMSREGVRLNKNKHIKKFKKRFKLV